MRATFVVAIACAVVATHASSARAGQGDPDERPAAAPDVGLPGPPIAYVMPPTLTRESKVCSMRLALCVHAHPGVPVHRALEVLDAAERAWETLTGALSLPSPDVDPFDPFYPIYVFPNGAIDGETLLAGRDVRSKIDRARAFTVLDSQLPTGCALDALVARELAHAILYRVAPATAPGIAAAQTRALADLVAPCTSASTIDAARAFQSRPERAVCDADVGSERSPVDVDARSRAEAFMRGASLFWSRIDWAYGRTPGSTLMASWALTPTMTDVGAARWHDEPDAFDVLRVTFNNALSTGSSVDDLLLDTAIARAFMGSADDGSHHPETAALGDAAVVPFDWDLPWPAEPKRVAPRAYVQPTGASYVVVRRAGAPPMSRLRVEIAWEEHALFRWAFVKIDTKGHELGRIVIPTQKRATAVQMTLVDLERADRVLLIGVNVGDPAYSFDPDDEAWEPHGWLLTLASEE